MAEVSFDVDGRFARLKHVTYTEDEHGEVHVVYVLTVEEDPSDG